MRPIRRPQLRYAHSRQRYAAAVTRRLTGFRRAEDIFSKPLKSLSARGGQQSSRMKLQLSKPELSIEIISVFNLILRLLRKLEGNFAAVQQIHLDFHCALHILRLPPVRLFSDAKRTQMKERNK
jgi:hypothetical protein